MSDEITFKGIDEIDCTDLTSGRTLTDFTQVASCAVGTTHKERRQQSLRARLEREQFDREQDPEETFVTTFRNLFKNTA